ncbi:MULTISPECIES: hypothetical protein [unclassified Sphingobium]|uniref:hypothetical protein n=1 Tax=unclassified Sphingobium TaxID=2611147 RepID=UPI000D170EA6|nr:MULTISPECIES: hypothetical protein [unclassified Sphingobium]PSO12608.1 hypothetical protein C7E20_05720 [Sphingobium sp. AEW4]TWD09785.1 hypothetical protein FB595_104132 [Sphingobium sp. AEW010]TWD26456.1 hypothetical protein FB596_104132 [Sphingobium sp. AEW013]TWD27775.1 hypothetical protein FB594_105196 [Sphingobium sp. AEW001]
MDEIIELDQRISTAVVRGRGIRLSDEELDTLVQIGAIEVLKAAAGVALKQRTAVRQKEREEYRALRLSGDPAKEREAVQIAAERARRVGRPKARVPKSAFKG